MSFYVRYCYDEREGWSGPWKSKEQADRQVQGWLDHGGTAEVVRGTVGVLAEVRAWRRREGEAADALRREVREMIADYQKALDL